MNATICNALDTSRQPDVQPPDPTEQLLAEPLRIAVPGIGADSPFARQLAQAAEGIADLIPAGGKPEGGWLWRRSVRGTALDAFGGKASAGPAGPAEAGEPELLLDLHGCAPSGPMPVWRITDGFGNALMRPFGCLAGPDRVISLYLTESIGGAAESRVLAQAHITSRRQYRALLDAIGRAAIWLVARALQTQPSQPAAMAFPVRLPSPGRFVAGRLSSFRAWLRDRAGSDIWAIGRVDGPAQRFLNSQTVSPDSWLEIPVQEGFVADPFPCPTHPGAILYERYSHRTGRGTLEALVPAAGTGGVAQRLDLPVRGHLSYPFPYVEDDTAFCLPEMAGENRQILYVLEPDGSVREHAIVAEDVAMADPTLFRYAGLYWIAYNDASLGLHENLCLRFADRLEGPWTAHPLNPVKIDVRCSRPGGTPFRVGETLFRPAQDCSRSYGCALTINRVVACAPDRYDEIVVARLMPDPNGRYPHGMHTFSVTPDGILLDGKRIAFSPGIMLKSLRRRLRRAWRRP